MLKLSVNSRRVSLFAIIASCLITFCKLPLSYFSGFSNHRRASVNLGDGECEWTYPSYESDFDSDKDYFKTLVTGYPGVAKRMVYAQMEALVGLPTNDEWPHTIAVEDKPNRPFWKANYPHHEGYWTWSDVIDQTVLVLRNPRHAIEEYHAIRWDVNYATQYDEALDNVDSLYVNRPDVDDFITWRDERIFREIKWWGWHIDYWMEGGIMRDNMSNKYTTAEHFFYMLNPSAYGDDGSLFVKFVGEELVPPTYDDRCIFEMKEKCQPVAVVSIERLMDYKTGVNETSKIANTIKGKTGLDVIAEEAWPCIWKEVIVHKKGPKIMTDREGPSIKEYDFTDEQLVRMLSEIDRLKTKYDDPAWRYLEIARDLVDVLEEYHLDITDCIKKKEKI